jgi:hypothetical protein
MPGVIRASGAIPPKVEQNKMTRQDRMMLRHYRVARDIFFDAMAGFSLASFLFVVLFWAYLLS